MQRELAWIELDNEPPDEEGLMDDQTFDEEVQLAAEGRWEELGLDRLPDDWKPVSIDELRDAV